MKNIILLITLNLFALNCWAQDYLHPSITDPDFQEETTHFIFFNHFWLNAHHFLYNSALNKVGEEAENLAILNQQSDQSTADIAQYHKAITFYKDSIIQFDLRRSGYLYTFKRWIIQNEKEAPLPEIEGAVNLINTLNDFKKIYEDYFWPEHQKSNTEVIDKNLNLSKKNEDEFVNKLTEYCKTNWQKDKIRVDVSFNSKRDIPYTTTRPTTHIIMDSKLSPKSEGTWYELLLHEASHNLIKSSSGFVGGTIQNESDVSNIKPPRQLWHAYLFYFTGHTAQMQLREEGFEDYELYMIRERVFLDYVPLLKKHLLPYMNKEVSLGMATRNLLINYNEEQQGEK